MRCATTVGVVAEQVHCDILPSQGFKIRCQSLEESRYQNLVNSQVTSPFSQLEAYACGIVWGCSGLYALYFNPHPLDKRLCMPEYLRRRWPQLSATAPLAPLEQGNLPTIREVLPPSAHGTLILSGTPFQQRVWRALLDIPDGETRTYAALASHIGHPHAYRAVANAVAANPLVGLVPCHRVLPHRGGVGGFRYGTAFKRRLLEREGVLPEQKGTP
ncbi:MAG: methylated-DNA--[protein]-cysteine S-methyltransferase [Geobacteraceae bacterium]|nr:methylated-DNA--[protein]-cysteine S-methyltransferase [Geobacteraceae bacterium]